MALAWALPSFLLHCVLHESAHAVAAKWYGAYGIRIWPFPSRRTGRFTWAYAEWSGIVKPEGDKVVLIAPVIAELTWFAAIWMALLFVPFGWWLGLMLVELLASIVDVITWVLPFFAKASEASDAKMFQKAVGGSLGGKRALSVVGVLLLLGMGIGAFLARFFVLIVVS